MIRAIAAISFVCTAVWSSGLARADEMDPQVVIEGRQANLRDLGAAFKAITDELKKSAPSLAVIRQYAGQVDALAQQQRFWFPRGSGPESEIETDAKPEIWSRTKNSRMRNSRWSLKPHGSATLLAAVIWTPSSLQHRAVERPAKAATTLSVRKSDRGVRQVS